MTRRPSRAPASTAPASTVQSSGTQASGTQGSRVLIVSHGHPAITCGGAEMAAHALFRALRATPGCVAWFLGCQPGDSPGRLGAGITQPFGAHEFIYRPGAFDWLKFANRDPAFPGEFRALLQLLRPDVVHFHHFIHLGVEAIAMVRQVLPQARIVLTLHEFLAICHHHGQMVTTGHEALCQRATLDACHRCFPAIPRQEFFLRELYIRRFLSEVDVFIAPSRFMAERFAEWGIDPGRIQVIENIVDGHAAMEASDPERPVGEPLRVGFFGQISRLKGIDVLFAAAAILARMGSAIEFEIHGEYRGQPPEYQEAFLAGLATAADSVRYHGRYRPDQLDRLMRRVDVTLVPSIWWENSPVVIQEAFRNRRPVICSDLGGMAEKVRHGQDGWRFEAGNAAALATLLRRLDADRTEITRVRATLQGPPDEAAVLAAHRRCFAAAGRRTSCNHDGADAQD